MRLIISAVVLLVTALDFRYGSSGIVLRLAGLIAGTLLALSLVADRILKKKDTRERRSGPSEIDRLRSEPGG